MTRSIEQVKKWLLQKKYSEEDLTINERIPEAIKLSSDNNLAPLYVTSRNLDIPENRVRIWNEGEAEAIFIWDGNELGTLLDAKVPPTSFTHQNSSSITCSIPSPTELFSGAFWAKYADRFISNKRKTIDEHLVEALEHLLKCLLSAGLEEATAHGLIDRCLFASFLDHRNLWKSDMSLTDALGDSDAKLVNKIFNELAVRFNGDLSRAPIPGKLDVKKLSLLSDVFGPNFYQGGQGSLYPYRFDLINVDLISSIFEKFIEATSRWSNNESGTHYSPPQVAWRVVEQTIKPIVDSKNEEELRNIKIIDPCCGSGIFLVHAFKYLKQAVNKKRKRLGKPNLNHAESVNILMRCIRGWDIEPTAIRIASFSLSLSLLDGFKKIPKSFKFPNLIDKVLIVRDGLLNGHIITDDESRDILYPPETSYEEKEVFDIVVGNPPWGFKNFSKSYKDILKKKYPQPNKGSSSEAFAFKFLELAGEKGRVGMMLNSSVWANRTSSFRIKIDETRRLETVIELANVHKILGYSKSGENTSILIFDESNKETTSHGSMHLMPIATPFSELLNIILISQSQIKPFNLSEINDLDIHFGINPLAYLKSGKKHKSIIDKVFGCFGESLLIDAQKGGQIKRGSKINHPFKASYLGYLSYESAEYSKISPDFLRRTAEKSQSFPILLRRHEIRGRLRVAVKQDDFTVLDDVIALGSNYVNEFALSAIFSSKFAFYLLRFLARQFGQRQQSYLDDTSIKLFPMPKEDKNNKAIFKELERIAKILSKQNLTDENLALFTKHDLQSDMKQIDQLVYELYGLSYLEGEIIENYFFLNTERPSVGEMHIEYERVFKDLAGIENLFREEYLGGLVTGMSTSNYTCTIPHEVVPTILSGGVYYAWNDDDVTIFRSKKAELWDVPAAIDDANSITAKLMAKRIRKTA